MDKNTMHLREFVLTQLWWSGVASVFFRKSCFTCFPGLSTTASKVVYWSLVAVLTVCGFIATYRKRRTNVSIMTNAIFPSSVYLLITYFEYFNIYYWILIVLCFITVVVYSVIILSAKIKGNRDTNKVMKKRCVHLLHTNRVIISAFMLLLIFSIGTNSMFGNPMFKTNIKSVNSASDTEWMVENNIDTISKLDKWHELSRAEKIEVLGVIRNIEICHLGLTHEVELGTSILGVATLGYYNEQTHQILLDTKHLDNNPPEAVLHTLLHEMYHTLQYEQVKAFSYIPEKYKGVYGFSDYIEYTNEFGNYVTATDDYFVYDNQQVEKLADKYAEERTQIYLDLINKNID